jgi:hypothetical protein
MFFDSIVLKFEQETASSAQLKSLNLMAVTLRVSTLAPRLLTRLSNQRINQSF